jgi:pimeloyl-ACP methyl ester carboxylesterase
VFLLPTWSIVHTDFWRRQVPHLSDRYTVLTFDGLGNEASDRPSDPAYYADDGFVEDAVKVMDAAGIEQAVTMSASMGATWQLLLADRFPERISACVYIAPDLPLAPLPPGYAGGSPSIR